MRRGCPRPRRSGPHGGRRLPDGPRQSSGHHPGGGRPSQTSRKPPSATSASIGRSRKNDSGILISAAGRVKSRTPFRVVRSSACGEFRSRESKMEVWKGRGWLLLLPLGEKDHHLPGYRCVLGVEKDRRSPRHTSPTRNALRSRRHKTARNWHTIASNHPDPPGSVAITHPRMTWFR